MSTGSPAGSISCNKPCGARADFPCWKFWWPSPSWRWSRACCSRSSAAHCAMTKARMRAQGFTLLELLIALSLMALVAGVLFGALQLSARSWDAGEERSDRAGQMRLAQELLRTELGGAFPFRWKKIQNQPIA